MLVLPYLGVRGFYAFFPALLLPLLIWPRSYWSVVHRVAGQAIWPLVFALVFFAYFGISAWIKWQPYDDVMTFRPDGVEHPVEWLAAFIVLVLTFLRFANIGDLWVKLNALLLPVLALGLLFAGLIYVEAYVQYGPVGDVCRTTLGLINPNILAFFIGILFAFGFAFLLGEAAKPFMAYCVLAAGAIAIVIFTGSRMGILAYCMTTFLIGWMVRRPSWGFGLSTGVVLVVAIAAATLVTELIGCGLLDRVQSLATPTDMEKSEATALRLGFWKSALAALDGNWLLGLDMKSEAALSYPHQHIHNQFLSWTIWGGIIGAFIGIAFLVSLPLWGAGKLGWRGFALAGSCCGFAGIFFLTDSNLYLFVNLVQFCIWFGFCAAVIVTRQDAPENG